jgi:hypothetical protein
MVVFSIPECYRNQSTKFGSIIPVFFFAQLQMNDKFIIISAHLLSVRHILSELNFNLVLISDVGLAG